MMLRRRVVKATETRNAGLNPRILTERNLLKNPPNPLQQPAKQILTLAKKVVKKALKKSEMTTKLMTIEKHQKTMLDSGFESKRLQLFIRPDAKKQTQKVTRHKYLIKMK